MYQRRDDRRLRLHLFKFCCNRLLRFIILKYIQRVHHNYGVIDVYLCVLHNDIAVYFIISLKADKYSNKCEEGCHD